MVSKNILKYAHKTIMKEKKIKRNPQIPPMNGGKGVDVSKTLFYAGSDENALLANALEEHRVRLELVSVIMEGSEKTGP